VHQLSTSIKDHVTVFHVGPDNTVVDCHLEKPLSYVATESEFYQVMPVSTQEKQNSTQ
jgi:hypothetical protein